MVENMKLNKKRSKSIESKKQTSPSNKNNKSTTKYQQFLSLILFLFILIIGTSSGTFDDLQSAMEAPCLGCLGLYPDYELNFYFDTVDDRPHPDWVLEALEDGPLFIEYTQHKLFCEPCGRMDPKIEELVHDYKDEVTFFIININDHEVKTTFKDTESIHSSENEEIDYHIYDKGNIAAGKIGTPTYIIITLEKDKNGEIKPYFAVGYGEFKEEDAEKTKQELAAILDFAIARYEFYKDEYLA